MTDQLILDTIAALEAIPGGRAVLDWFHGQPEFGDSEVVEVRLDRTGSSMLRLAVPLWRDRPAAMCTFHLTDMLDVALQGFSHQNVIGGLLIRSARARDVHPTLRGIGLVDGDHEIELEPCAGAFGIIRATIESVALEPA